MLWVGDLNGDYVPGERHSQGGRCDSAPAIATVPGVIKSAARPASPYFESRGGNGAKYSSGIRRSLGLPILPGFAEAAHVSPGRVLLRQASSTGGDGHSGIYIFPRISTV